MKPLKECDSAEFLDRLMRDLSDKPCACGKRKRRGSDHQKAVSDVQEDCYESPGGHVVTKQVRLMCLVCRDVHKAALSEITR